MRCGDDRPAADREQRPGADVRERRDRARALHVLQQVPGERRGKSARLLRARAIQLARRDGARRSCRCSRRRPFDDEARAPPLISAALSPCLLVGGCRAATAAGSASVSRHRRALQVRLGRHRGAVGLPYWIWRVLPQIFADKLPKRPGEGLRADRVHAASQDAPNGRPIGTSYLPGPGRARGPELRHLSRRLVSRDADEPAPDRLGHAGEPDGPAGVRPFSHRLRAGSALRRRHDHGGDTQGEPGHVVARWVAATASSSARTKKGILERARDKPGSTRARRRDVGRVDTFNPYKVMLKLADGRHVGTVDLPSLWNQRMRQGMWLHWDGNNDSVEERNKSAAIGAGATPDSLDLPSLGASRLDTRLEAAAVSGRAHRPGTRRRGRQSTSRNARAATRRTARRSAR